MLLPTTALVVLVLIEWLSRQLTRARLWQLVTETGQITCCRCCW